MALECQDVWNHDGSSWVRTLVQYIPNPSFRLIYQFFRTVNHDQHRLRRSALNSFFSKQSVGRLEERILSSVDCLHSRLRLAAGSGKPVNLSDALTCLSADVIASYTFGESYHLTEREGFAPEWRTFMTVSKIRT